MAADVAVQDSTAAMDGPTDSATARQLTFIGRTAILDLGTWVADDQGLGPPLRFGLPPETRSAVAVTQVAGQHAAVSRWQDGAGKLLVVPSWTASGQGPWLCLSGCLFRQALRPAEQAMLVPNAPHPVTLGGVHTLTPLILHWQGQKMEPGTGSVGVRVVAVRGPALSSGILPVNLCLTGALGWKADMVGQLPRLDAAIQTLRDVLGGAGLALDLRVLDVQRAPTLIEHSTEDTELQLLFAAGAGLPLGVNVFLVEQLYVDQQGVPMPITGISGGIPGPPLAVGTAEAGVAVSLALGPGEDDRLGVAIAHEIGHFLGLFHTTEQATRGTQAIHDDLEDTPEQDTGNLMFWSPKAQSIQLSGTQQQILRDSPWIQEASGP